jgi:hypothetical protein
MSRVKYLFASIIPGAVFGGSFGFRRLWVVGGENRRVQMLGRYLLNTLLETTHTHMRCHPLTGSRELFWSTSRVFTAIQLDPNAPL